MDINKEVYMSQCISCSGTGRIKCDCGTEELPNSRCFTCNGDGNFICPVCDGEGKF